MPDSTDTHATDLLRQAIAAVGPPPDRPPLGRVEVGVTALAILKEFSERDTRGDSPYRPATYLPPVPSMAGVPVTTPDGMDPRAWRLIDTAGEVISEGLL